MRIVTAWCLVCNMYVLEERKWIRDILFADRVKIGYFLISICVLLLCITVLGYLLKSPNFDALLFAISVFLYGINVLYQNNDIYMAGSIVLVVTACAAYLLHRYRRKMILLEVKSRYRTWYLIFCICLVWALLMGLMSTMRYKCFRSPCFDFGIFSQMFYYMKERGMPYTTCERDRLLSHFSVHMSPVFYVLLPIYMLLPSPVTILILQVVIVISGVIPLYLLCKVKNLSNYITIMLCVVYCTFPATIGGFFYDFHENKFLLPLILWLFYFIEKKDKIWIAVCAILTLLVKEDAAIYVATIGLYLFFARKEKKKGAVLFITSTLYFILMVFLLNRFGEGAMTNRYDNFMSTENEGLVGMLINVMKNPAYALSQIFVVEKVEFMLWMFLPFMFLPLRQKKYSEFLLLIPFLVVNLMSNYEYQHSIYFQYTYGVTAIFFYMSIRYLEGRESASKKYTVVYMALASILLCVSAISPKATYIGEYIENGDEYAEMERILEKIPKEASVEASTCLVATLSSRDKVYREGTKWICEYVALDMREGGENMYASFVEQKKQQGYEIVYYSAGHLMILRLPHS